MNLILLTGLLFILFASLTESFQLRERYFETNSIKQKQLNFWWHKFQLLERTFAIGFGIALATLNSLTEMVVALFLIASIFWIVYDGFIMLMTGRTFFQRTTTTTSWFRFISYPELKIGVFFVMVILAIIIF